MSEELIKNENIYSVGLLRVPNITLILDHFGFYDKYKRFYTDESRDRGTLIHRYCAEVNLGTIDWGSVPDEILGAVWEFYGWVQDVGFEPIFVERPEYSKNYWYAGTADLFGKLRNGRLATVELKSNQAGEATALQTAAQAQLISENHPRFPSYMIDRYALKGIGAERPKIVPYEDRRDLPVFLGLVAAFNYKVEKNIIQF